MSKPITFELGVPATLGDVELYGDDPYRSARGWHESWTAAQAEIDRLNGYLKDQSDSIKAYEDEVTKLSAVVEAARGAMQSELSHEHEGHYYLDITPRLANHLRAALSALEEKPADE